MRGAVLYGPGDVRFEDREKPKIEKATDAVSLGHRQDFGDGLGGWQYASDVAGQTGPICPVSGKGMIDGDLVGNSVPLNMFGMEYFSRRHCASARVPGTRRAVLVTLDPAYRLLLQ